MSNLHERANGVCKKEKDPGPLGQVICREGVWLGPDGGGVLYGGLDDQPARPQNQKHSARTKHLSNPAGGEHHGPEGSVPASLKAAHRSGRIMGRRMTGNHVQFMELVPA